MCEERREETAMEGERSRRMEWNGISEVKRGKKNRPCKDPRNTEMYNLMSDLVISVCINERKCDKEKEEKDEENVENVV